MYSASRLNRRCYLVQVLNPNAKFPEHSSGKHREQSCCPQDLACTVPGLVPVEPDPPPPRPLDQVTDDRDEPSVDALARL